MSNPWFVLKLQANKSQLALKTLKRLEIKFAYPERRTRVPRRPDLVEPIIPGYALVSFDPSQRIRMTFPNGNHYMHWTQFQYFPGVANLFHDHTKPLSIAERYINDMILDVDDPICGYQIGKQVRIMEGPFKNFMAIVKSIDDVNGLISVSGSIFGRDYTTDYTPENLEIV